MPAPICFVPELDLDMLFPEIYQKLFHLEDKMPRITPLKQEIVKRGLLQADIAEIAELSESRLSRIVNGRVKPREYERKVLAKALGIEREDLPI